MDFMRPTDVYILILYIGLITGMGCIFSKIINDVSNIEILDYTPQGPEYDYLRPTGIITVEMDEKWKVPVIHFDLDGWSPTFIRLWHENNQQRENFLILPRTPLPTPSSSSSSEYGDSGFDTVF